MDLLKDNVMKLDQIIAQMPGLVFWKDRELKYQGCNANMLRAMGLKSQEECINLTDYDMPWAKLAEQYRSDDRVVLTGRKIKRIEPFVTHDKQVVSVYVEKKPIRNENNEIIGVIGFTQLFSSLEGIHKEHLATLCLTPAAPELISELFNGLSLRESQVLYYYVRGFSMSEVGEILSISPRTVEIHLVNIKDLFECKNKSELIHCAFENGFVHFIPNGVSAFLNNKDLPMNKSA